ncbi:MAG: hypothetical protein NPINA01_13380 [Nitrospinaceae bacterium]|nr:MAG: hypothetical protein NPINA01_13380 [Nitrospinaceae bacterium]
MTESTKTSKEVMQEFIGSFTELAEEAEKRRKAASAKWELYKVEFSAGEKKAYEDAAKKLKAALAKL